MINVMVVLDKIQENKRNWLQYIKRMFRNKLLTVLKFTDWQAEEKMGDHKRDFWMCETGMGQQVA